ncbi:MAG: DNA-directed RNA polymerase subunit omega [Nitrospirota bacterium]|nr:DNA-directed RNA polymerase subunit omega [Nitrospirota bacterium]MDE3035815.1 DNA-directed RNA polymerase subunit omega [Nitrospirota bacterium]MDE3119609.1 DNA-directed RNA polymerase subunit omega [Nitrospirota bacterium]MDE3223877.1 DNA-directed RNA polymerase subunit omega [Nitrospirota bacterium]MDE3242381.1 DNA-directed RNA polymerase subunit omega [Nitrospirota bacterium]
MIDMLSLLPESNHELFDSRHRLVIAAAQRAKHLTQGAPLMGPTRFTKETTQALDEVLHGRIHFLTGKEARQALKEVKKGRESELERAVTVESAEDAREIKKELSVYVDDSPKTTESDSEE